ncbi:MULTISPECIES: nitrogen fixation protein NifZ [unclassified Frankia]|uniref:nitrogen fixation protein NifZ n=1 Tax=unclassified Frankia TaxID=2632575 RepID=UPI002AD44E48|nr:MULTISPECIES: nitrogen fixation protein NifZ [unclassified Frankia]
MRAAFDIGDEVSAVKALRNDGTYPEPGVAVGDVLVDAGSVGHVRGVGLYLQEHIVYAVAFTNGRVVGCLEKELSPATVAAGHETRHETRHEACHEGGEPA